MKLLPCPECSGEMESQMVCERCGHRESLVLSGAPAPALPDRETREAVELLDLVELPTVGSFDGSIAGGPPWSIDLFRPGPEFESWAEKVRENRRQRAALRGPQTKG